MVKDDAVSRQAVIKAVVDYGTDFGKYGKYDMGFSVQCIKEAVELLPSVEPKRKEGHWIDALVGELPVQVCDQCHTFFPLEYTGGGHHFCPHCGAEMVFDEEEHEHEP